MNRNIPFATGLLFVTAIGTNLIQTGLTYGQQEPVPSPRESTKQDNVAEVPLRLDVEIQSLHEKLKSGLSNTKFIGRFTSTGQEDELPREEEYTITTVRKLEKGDFWEITARIKYGDHDVTVPMAMEIKWAGTTPVITVDQLFVPGLGTFDARVLLRKDQYAGTWSHGNDGGHLFGRIEKIKQTEPGTPKE